MQNKELEKEFKRIHKLFENEAEIVANQLLKNPNLIKDMNYISKDSGSALSTLIDIGSFKELEEELEKIKTKIIEIEGEAVLNALITESEKEIEQAREEMAENHL